MLGIDKFENAIIEFGVDLALEYFATPKEFYPVFDGLREKEREQNETNHE